MNVHERRRIAYHEAGHAVVARHEGFRSDGIKVHLKGGAASTTPRLPNATLSAFASARLRVLLAGAVAQCVVLDPDNRQCMPQACARHDAEDDWRKAQEVISLLAHDRTRGLCDDDRAMDVLVNDITREHVRQTAAILEANRSPLDEVAHLVIVRFTALFAFSPSDLNAPHELEVERAALQSALSGIRHVPASSALKKAQSLTGAPDEREAGPGTG